MVPLFIGKSRVSKDEMSPGPAWSELKARNGEYAGRPIDDAPCLDESLARNHVQMPADDVTIKKGERASELGADLGGCSGAGTELLRIRQHLVNTTPRRGKIDFVINRKRGLFLDWRVVS